MRSAGAFSTATATLSLLGLPVVAIASKFAGVRELLEANTALLATAAAAAIACETLGGPEAVWAGVAELSPSGAAGGAAAASGVLWWAPHTTLLLLALGGTAGPVLLLALVPTLHLGCSLGHAYGELETLSVLGQARPRVCVHAPAYAHACACTYMRVVVRAFTRACMAPGGIHAAPRCGAHWVRLQGRAVGAATRAARRLRRRARLRPHEHRRCGGRAAATGRGRASHTRADASQHGGRVAPPAEDKLVAAHEDHTSILATSPSVGFSRCCLNMLRLLFNICKVLY